MRTTPQALNLSRWQKVALFVGFWTVLSLLDGAENYAGQMFSGKPISWGLGFRRAFEQFYTWAVISLGILWLAERYHHFDRGHGKRWFVVHGIGSIVVAILYATIYAGLLRGQRSIMDGSIFTFPDAFRKLLIHYTIVNVIIYWMIVLAHHGWHYYRRYREREVQTTDRKSVV